MTQSPLTILAMPKPFRGHIGVIQHNAIQSWTRLSPRPDILLCGDEDGTAQVATELGVSHLRNIARNHSGTPLLDDVFRHARQSSESPLLCYINCDIILLQAFQEAIAKVRAHFPEFLAVTYRWEIDLPRPLQFADGHPLRLEQLPPGRPGHHTAIDVFVFTRDLYVDVPALAIGRAWFDQWLIKDAVERGIPVVDITSVARAIHQKHDYGHISGGQQGAYAGDEARRNLEIYGGVPHAFTLLHATHELVNNGSIRALRFRPEKFRLQQWAWRNFVERTAAFRKRLGLTQLLKRNAHQEANQAFARSSAESRSPRSQPAEDPKPNSFVSLAASLWMLTVLLIFLVIRVLDSTSVTHALHRLGYR
jgi:hypothetical protein